MSLEVAALCAFPWDFADKGVDATLARCRDWGISHLLLAVSYHAGYFFYPDNPVRRVHLLEDGVTYFRPRAHFYQETPLKPLVATMCAERDWVATIVERLDHFGLQVGAWTVCLHNSRLGLLHPDCTVQNALGDSYPHALCPSDPRVQGYVLGLVRDLIDRFHPALLLLEATDYRGRRHGSDWVGGHHHERDGTILAPLEQTLFDLSFAPSDLAAAALAGIDGEAVRHAVADHLRTCLAAYPKRPPNRPATLGEFEDALPVVAAYRACLQQQTVQLGGLIRAVTAPAGVQLVGGDPTACDWRLAGAYGKTPGEIATLARTAKAAAQPHQKVMVGIRLGFNPPTVGAIHSESQLVRSVCAAAEGGATGVYFYNLAESPLHTLNWIAPALRPSQPPTLRPVRLGLVGCGGISEAYLRASQRLAEVEIVAVADVDIAQAQQRAAQFGIATAVRTGEELLATAAVDALVVAVPPRWHAELLLMGLAAGKAVLMEKPLGLNLAEADTLVDAALAAGHVVGMGLVHRYLPFYRVIRDLIRGGSLGRVRQIRVQTGRNLYTDPRFRNPAQTRGGWLTQPQIAGGGILMSSTIHLLSVCAFLLDNVPFTEVGAQVRQLHAQRYPGIEDDVTLFVTADNGIELQVEDSWVRDWSFALEVWGEAGWVRAQGPTWATNVVLTGKLMAPLPAYPELKQGQEFMVNAACFEAACLPLFDGLLADFAASVRTGQAAPDLPGILHARNMQAIVAASYVAARQTAAAPVDWRKLAEN
ncbi:MAG: gfo/Idh/MocA family oxidoreductase [Caldilinea sp. CFX5]|nr:gfo/Idh/MocA family oxidoreductase [Caldilinea sp. CFX5]